MSYLKMALAALQATTGAGESGAQRCGYTSQAPNYTPTTEAPQASPPACPVTCAAACPWYARNPWTHYPTFGAWCHRRMEHLVVGRLACEEFRHGEVPPRQNHERVLQVQPLTSPAPQEHVLTCSSCPHFEANHGPNPRQGWGRCLKRNKGRYGCATACEAALSKPGIHNLKGE